MSVQNALLTMAAIVAFSVPTTALAGSVTATAAVSVTILAPVTLQSTQSLDFGAITKPNAASNSVTLDASGHLTVTGAGDATHPSGTVTAAKFDLVGQAGVTYSTTQSLSFDQPGLTNVTASAPVVGGGALGVIPPSGRQELRYGGAFDVSNATPLGAYTGALTVIVNYN